MDMYALHWFQVGLQLFKPRRTQILRCSCVGVKETDPQGCPCAVSVSVILIPVILMVLEVPSLSLTIGSNAPHHGTNY